MESFKPPFLRSLRSSSPEEETLHSIIKGRLKYFYDPKEFPKEFKRFAASFFIYIKNKSLRIVPFSKRAIYGFLALEERIRFELVRRLIWSRGKHGKVFAHASLAIFALVVFLVGSVFRSEVIVHQDPPRQVFLRSGSFIQDAKVVRTSIVAGRTGTETTEYTVQQGDTLSSIGQKFGISADALRYSNNMQSADELTVGSTLVIPPVEGAIHTVSEGDTLSSIAQRYEVAEQAIADFNYLLPPFTLNINDTLIIPDASIPPPPTPRATVTGYAQSVVQTFTTRVTGGTVGTGAFMVPTSVLSISQYFTWYHSGIDISGHGQSDLSIRAADGGTVEMVAFGWNWGYGNRVIVNHGNGYQSTYSHLADIHVSSGQTVNKGDVIGIMGTTGRSTGVHLHFEILRHGVFVNPLEHL